MELYQKSPQKSIQLELFNPSQYQVQNLSSEGKIDTSKFNFSLTPDSSRTSIDADTYFKRKKSRRAKGQGTGHLFCKPCYRNTFFGTKRHEQWWYQWEENGVRKSRYVKKRLLELVKLLEKNKRPVSKIVEILNR